MKLIFDSQAVKGGVLNVAGTLEGQEMAVCCLGIHIGGFGSSTILATLQGLRDTYFDVSPE